MPADIWMVLEGSGSSEDEFKEKIAQKMNDEYEAITGNIPDFRLMRALSEIAFNEFRDLL